MPDWSPVRRFGGYGAWGEKEGAPLQARLRRAPCPPAAASAPAASTATTISPRPPVDSGGRSRELLGSAGMRLLGSVTVRWLALLALCAAYLQGGLYKAFDFAAPSRDAALRRVARRAAGAGSPSWSRSARRCSS
jgi:hypothetical protein